MKRGDHDCSIVLFRSLLLFHKNTGHHAIMPLSVVIVAGLLVLLMKLKVYLTDEVAPTIPPPSPHL